MFQTRSFRSQLLKPNQICQTPSEMRERDRYNSADTVTSNLKNKVDCSEKHKMKVIFLLLVFILGSEARYLYRTRGHRSEKRFYQESWLSDILHRALSISNRLTRIHRLHFRQLSTGPPGTSWLRVLITVPPIMFRQSDFTKFY